MPFIESVLHVHIMDDPDVYYIAGLPSETHPADVIRIAAAALLLTLLATIYPAFQGRPDPARRGVAIRMMRYWYEGFLGLRYLRASPKRGFLSLIAGIAILGLALGVAVLIVVLSVMNGFEQELRTRILSLTAHATIAGLEGRISDWRPQAEKVAHFPGVIAAAPYIEEQALMTHEGKSAGVLLRGVLPEDEQRVVDLAPHLQSGRLGDLSAGLLPGDPRIRARGSARRRTSGDRVVLMVPEGDVTPIGVLPRMRAFRVDGILSVGMYEYDRRIAIVAMQDAATLLRMGDDITGIRLNLTDPYAAPRIVHAAAVALGGGFEVDDWTNQHVNFFRSIEITKRMLFVILSLVVAVAAFNIVSTMVMVVKDKRRDIAILRTFGSSPRSILSVFMVQGSADRPARYRSAACAWGFSSP